MTFANNVSNNSRGYDDEYAGMMTPRERQWIVNIQLQQLKCENPYVDDYYFTVNNLKRQMAEEIGKEEAEDDDDDHGLLHPPGPDEEGPQLLLSESAAAAAAHARDEYTPTQFTNSLGKLQAINVKAPRKIIDLSVVNTDAHAGDSAAQKDSRNYKSTLLELERLYALVIDVEDCEKKLAALPTGSPLRLQV